MRPKPISDCIVFGTPISAQARRRALVRAWTEFVRKTAAENDANLVALAPADYLVRITYFADAPSLDVDNIAKPILDGIKANWMIDDQYVTDLVVRKRRLDHAFDLDGVPVGIVDALRRGAAFTWIELHLAPPQGAIA
jgi:crossover junction endodeoxyribonuclease RusA